MERVKRRTVCALGLGTLVAAAWAQGRPVEGQHYKRLSTPQPVQGPKGEVLEFFWYGCPHCYALEPALDQWLQRKPSQIGFRRSAAIIRAQSRPHQRLFFSLDALGQEQRLHAAVFKAIQVEQQPLQELPEMQALVARLGVDPARFAQMYQSFGVQTRCQQADALMQSYQGTSVPLLGVNGRYITSPAMAGGDAQAMQVVDYLLARA